MPIQEKIQINNPHEEVELSTIKSRSSRMPFTNSNLLTDPSLIEENKYKLPA